MNSIRRAVATFSIVAILSSFVVSTASAATGHFKDVTEGQYWYNAIEQLAEDGVVDTTKDTFTPAGALIRGEAARYLVMEAGFELVDPATPYFTDVPKTHKYYKEIETAYAHGVVKGDSDAAGNALKTYRPDATLNRAEFARMSVLAFELPAHTPDTATFSDVKDTKVWYYADVYTAAFHKVISGYLDGSFKPANAVSKGEGAQMTYAALNVEAVVEPGDEEETGGEGGVLTVSLAEDTPDGAVVPGLAVNVPFTKVELSAAVDAVTVSQLTVTRKGLGSADDLDKVSIIDGEDNTVLAKGRSLTTEEGVDSVTFTFSPALEVGKGITRYLLLSANIGSVAVDADSGAENALSIVEADAIVTNASSIKGDFPVTGEKMVVAAVDMGTITLDGTGADKDYNIGEEDALVAEFDIDAPAAGDGAAELNWIRLENKGDAGDEALTNLVLEIDGEQIATAAGIVDDYILFTLDEPYLLEEGNTYSASIYATIAGEQGKDVKLLVDETTDVYAESTKYDGYGMDVDIDDFDAVGDAADIDIIGADITVSFDGPIASDTGADTKNYIFANFKILAADDVEFSTLEVEVTEVDGNADTDVADLDNLELYDATNNLLYSADDGDGADGTVDAPNTYTFDDVYLTGGTQYTFELRADVPDTAEATDTYQAGIDFTNALAEWINTGEDVEIADSLSSTTLTGKTMTVAAPTMTAKVITLNAVSAVENTQGVLLYKSTLEANNVRDLKVSKIIADVEAGSTLTLAQLSKIYLVQIVGTTETVLDSINNPTGATATFSGFVFNIPKGTANKVTYGVRGNIKNDPTAGTLILEVDADANYTVKDSENNTVTGADLVPDTTNGPVITIAANGTLDYSFDFTESGTNTNKYMIAGNKTLVARIKLDAANEDVKIRDWTLDVDGTAIMTPDDVLEVAFYSDKAMTAKEGSTTLSAAGGVATFEDLNFVVPKDGIKYLYVGITTKGIGDEGDLTGTSEDTFLLDALVDGDIVAEGVSTGETLEAADKTQLTNTASDSKIVTMFATGAVEIKNIYTGSTALSGGVKTLFQFSVKVPDNINVTLGEKAKFELALVRLDLAGAEYDDNAALAAEDLGVSDVTVERLDKSTDGEVDATLATTADIDTFLDIDFDASFTTDYLIEAGETAQFAVYGTISDVDDNSSFQATLNALDDGNDGANDTFLWSDGTTDGIGGLYLQGVTKLQGHTLTK